MNESTTAESALAGTEPRRRDPLLRDEPTIELVTRARSGDMPAMEALLQRCLPAAQAVGPRPPARGGARASRHGRPGAGGCAARARQPRHVRAASRRGDAGLSSSVGRSTGSATRCGASAGNPPPLELPDDHPSDRTSPEEDAIRAEEYDHYREAVPRLTPKDRALIVARIEMQWSLAEIAHRYGMPSVDAARMAVNRAVKRLSADFAARRK